MEDFHDGLQFEIVDALKHDLLVFLVQIDLGFGILQVKARLNFFPRLLNCIQDLGHLDNGNDIKAVVWHNSKYNGHCRGGLFLEAARCRACASRLEAALSRLRFAS